ncbi:MAG: Fur family transcriptional regulator, partial [Acidimicrobiales bacterium]
VEAILANADHHVTAAELVEVMRADEPEFHESTVYRVLERLAELGVVEPVQLSSGPTVFHVADRPHHHLVCSSCGSVTEAPADLLDDITERVRGEAGFAVSAAAPATLHGRCARCR